MNTTFIDTEVYNCIGIYYTDTKTLLLIISFNILKKIGN